MIESNSRQVTFNGKTFAVVLDEGEYILLISLDEEADADGFIRCLWSRRDELTGRLLEPSKPDGYVVRYHVLSGEIELIEGE